MAAVKGVTPLMKTLVMLMMISKAALVVVMLVLRKWRTFGFVDGDGDGEGAEEGSRGPVMAAIGMR